MPLFQRKTVIFQEKNKEKWLKARAALKEAGIGGIQAGAFEENPVCGCGAKLDPGTLAQRGRLTAIPTTFGCTLKTPNRRKTYWRK